MTPHPYFRIQAEENPIGQRTRRLNAEECCFYRDQVQAIEFASADLGKLAVRLRAHGTVPTQRTIQLMLGFTYRIVAFFPKVAHLSGGDGLISVPMACAIEPALQDLLAEPDPNSSVTLGTSLSGHSHTPTTAITDPQ